jgi:hypothetical protein
VDERFASRRARREFEYLVATKQNSLELIGADSMQAETDSRQTGFGFPAADGVAVRFGPSAAKRMAPWLILCAVLGLWSNPERATADRQERAGACGVRSSTSVAGLRIANGRRLTAGWAGGFPLSNAMLSGGGNRIIESAGVALFVSVLSPYLPQGLPRQPGNDACLREPEEYTEAGRQQQFPLHLEFLAWLFFCGFVSWGGTVWMERR